MRCSAKWVLACFNSFTVSVRGEIINRIRRLWLFWKTATWVKKGWPKGTVQVSRVDISRYQQNVVYALRGEALVFMLSKVLYWSPPAYFSSYLEIRKKAACHKYFSRNLSMWAIFSMHQKKRKAAAYVNFFLMLQTQTYQLLLQWLQLSYTSLLEKPFLAGL